MLLREQYRPEMDEVVLRACRVDQRYDRQFDAHRRTYLSFALDSLTRKDELLSQLWEGLSRSRRSHNQEQLLGIAATYAARGDQTAAQILERVCLRNHKAGHAKSLIWLIQGLGKPGLRYVLDHWVPEDRDDLDRRFAWAAEEALGNRSARATIRHAKTPAAKFLARTFEPYVEPAPDDVSALEQVQTSITSGSRLSLRAIRNLSVQDLQTLSEVPPDSQSIEAEGWLRVFSWRPFPGDPAVLERFARRGEINNRYFALYALAQLGGEVPRRAALRYWRHPQLGAGALKIFAKNFVPGDEALILACLQGLRPNYWFVSGIYAIGRLQDLVELPNGYEIQTFIYERSPDSDCRSFAFSRLIETGGADTTILQEALFDADGDTREEAAKALASKV